MEKIKLIYFHSLRANEHSQYFTYFQELLDAWPQVKEVVADLYPDFIERLDEEFALLGKIRKSSYTKYIMTAERRIERCLTGMSALLTSALHHFDPAMEDAAKDLYYRFKAFGIIRRKDYMAELSAIEIWMDALRSPEYAAKATLIGLMPWVDELAAAKTAFVELYHQRLSEAAQKPHGRLRVARRSVETVYDRMIDRIVAASIVGDTPGAFDEFIVRLNVVADKFRELLHRHAGKDLGKGGCTCIEPIPPQMATGKPVTVVPKVYYRDADTGADAGVELSLGHDFSITYRNNIRPGMAELTIRGKGGYTGKKRMTFSIEASIAVEG
ncbi:MAG: DUF6261 family protein [Prevotellaceae bacterium]|jgi:hypothetical protein|nr:DUF6261 family protein [Prevotellaceae bacterium]